MSGTNLSRRQALKLASMGATGVFLAACGAAPQSGGTTASSAAQASTAAAGSVATEASTAAQASTAAAQSSVTLEGFTTQLPPSSEQVKLVYWWGNNYEPALQYTNDIIAHFSEVYPNVTVEPVAGQNCDAFVTAAAAGTPPDLFHTWDCVERMGAWARRNLIIPLDDYIATDNFPMDDYVPGIMDTCKMDGKTWGMVDSAGVYLLWTRPPLLEEIGKDAKAAPQDTDELLAWSKQLTKADAGGSIERLGFRMPNYNWEYFAWIGLYGGQLWDTTTNEPTPDHPGVITALEDLVAQVKDYGAENLQRWTSGLGAGEGAQSPYLAGNLGFQVAGDWTGQSVGDFLPDWKFGEQYYAVAPPPAPASKQAGESVIAWWSWPWVIPAGTKQPNWSWELLRFYLSTDYQVNVHAKFREMLVRKSMIDDKRLAHPWIQTARDIVNGDRKVSTMMPMNPVAAEYANLLGEAFDSVTQLSTTPQDAMARVKTETKAKLEQSYQLEHTHASHT